MARQVGSVAWLGLVLLFAGFLLAGLLYGLDKTPEAAAFAPTPPETGTITIVKEAEPADGANFAFSSNLPFSDSVSVINTVAGNSSPRYLGGYSGDGGPAIRAELNGLSGVAVDEAGNFFIADTWNHRIRRVDANSGLITTVAGNGVQGYSGDGGPATAASLNSPIRVAIDSAGNVYIADSENHRIRRVEANTGLITTVAGNGTQGDGGDGALATQAALNRPYGLAFDSANNMFIAEPNNHRIRMVEAISGIITTVAGNGVAGFSGDGGLATGAQLAAPFDVGLDDDGNLFIADRDNQRIRKVDAGTRIIETAAGDGSKGDAGDGGPATSAKLNDPNGLGVDLAGNLFIADYRNQRIRRVDAGNSFINTVAGTGSEGFSGDAGPATAARLSFPFDVAINNDGGFFVAESGNNRVRKVFESSFILDDAKQDDGDGFGNTQLITGLPAGSYTFTETMASNWRLNHISCGNDSWLADLSHATLSVTLSSGENITCTFRNNLLPDLVMFKSADKQEVMPGETVSYTMGYINIGYGATNAVMTETVPLNSTFNPGASTPGWHCLPDNSAGSICTRSLGDVAYGPPAGIVHFVVDVDASLPLDVSPLENSASIGDDGLNGPDQHLGDNSAMETTLINHHRVEISGDDDQSAFAGTTVTYTLTITNAGVTKDIFDLVLSDNNWPSFIITDSVKLAAGFNTTIQVTVTIPAGVDYLESDMAIVTAISQGDSAQTDTTNLTTTALWDEFDLFFPMIVNNGRRTGLDFRFPSK